MRIRICIYPTLPPRAGFDPRVIFKQSKAGLNSVFSFSSTVCRTKAKEPSLPYYLQISGGGGEKRGSSLSQKVLYTCKYLFTQPLHHEQDAVRGQFLSGVLTGCQSKAKEPSLPHHSLREKRLVHAFPPRGFAQSKTQTNLSWI